MSKYLCKYISPCIECAVDADTMAYLWHLTGVQSSTKLDVNIIPEQLRIRPVKTMYQLHTYFNKNIQIYIYTLI